MQRARHLRSELGWTAPRRRPPAATTTLLEPTPAVARGPPANPTPADCWGSIQTSNATRAECSWAAAQGRLTGAARAGQEERRPLCDLQQGSG